jgi:hypothetical protein
MAVKTNDIDFLLKGKTQDEQDFILQGISHLGNTQNFILPGVVGIDDDLDFILAGKPYDEQAFILQSRNQDELGFILNAISPVESLIRFHFKEDEIDDFQITSGLLVNEITINYAYDFVDDKPSAAITKHNPLSKLLYGDAKKSFDLRMIQRTRQAEKITDAVLMTSSIPGIICSFRHNLRSLHLEVGDIVCLTHQAGLGENGYERALGMISKKRLIGIEIEYGVIMKASGRLYMSELVTLTQTASAGAAGITITYESGVATITIYADIQGSPKIEGAEVTISGIRKITDIKGQVRFPLGKGTYTAKITASGYEDAEITFTV